MTDIRSIGFALDPTNIPSFLLDWELTKLCNLDCSYCLKGLDGGHDNGTKHPPFDECIKTVDFMYQYVDLYMRHKKPSQRKVILNVYGGEALQHPDIVRILQYCREKHIEYKDRWYLTITCTSNGVTGKNRLQQVIPLVDEFTLSYHAENLSKQHDQFFENLMAVKDSGKRLTTIVMMHNDPQHWAKSMEAVEFCKTNNLRYLPKMFDNVGERWAYTADQFQFVADEMKARANAPGKTVVEEKTISIVKKSNVINAVTEGRACCGGRKMSLNNNLKQSTGYVPRQGFQGWYCSVNWFFMFVRQLDGAIFSNKDCRTSLDSKLEPLGNMKNSDHVLQDLKTKLDTKTMPVIQCVKDLCRCGFCAPKAETRKDFDELIFRNVVDDVFIRD